MSLVNQTAQWNALEEHWGSMSRVQMRDLFEQDPARAEQLTLHAADIFVDYSKNLINAETLALLIDLAQAADLPGWIRRMFSGDRINNTEKRSVLHIALRNRSNRPIYVDGEDVMPGINEVLQRLEDFVARVRNGDWRGYTGERITDVVNIGIGGSNLGPLMVCEALMPYQSDDLRVHFVSNVDGTHLADTVRSLDPTTTMFVVASKTFTTMETMTNANSARAWLVDAPGQRVCGGRPFRRRFHQRSEGDGIRNRSEQYVRVLGLGRRALFSVVCHRFADRFGRRNGPIQRAVGGCPCDGRALSDRGPERKPSRHPGLDRRLVRQLCRRPYPRGASLRPISALPAGLPAAGRYGEQRQARDPRGRCWSSTAQAPWSGGSPARTVNMPFSS